MSAQPVSARPVDAHPVTAQPVSAQPVDAHPVTARPVTAHSVSSLLAGLRAVYGTVQLLLPAYSAEQLLGGPLEPSGLAGVRVLGARQLAQAGLSVAAPTVPLLRLGAGIDAAHALSMVALALADPKWRRPALVSGLTATAFAVGGALAARRAAPNERRNNHAGL